MHKQTFLFRQKCFRKKGKKKRKKEKTEISVGTFCIRHEKQEVYFVVINQHRRKSHSLSAFVNVYAIPFHLLPTTWPIIHYSILEKLRASATFEANLGNGPRHVGCHSYVITQALSVIRGRLSWAPADRAPCIKGLQVT